ncbi:MAG: ABC transporter ATP-binding protein [bacterium]
MPMRGPGSMMQGGAKEKAKNFKGTMKNLLKYLQPYRISILVVVIFAVASTIFSIVSPKILGNVTNQIVDDYIKMKVYDQIKANLPANTQIPPGTTGAQFIAEAPAALINKIPADKLESIKSLDLSKKPGINFQKISNTILMLIGLYLLSMIFGNIQSWIMTNVSQKVTYKFRQDLSQKINRMPLKYFDTKTFGEVLSRVTNDVDTISQNLNQSMTQIITSITMVIGILIMMLTISWQLTIVALLVLPLSSGFIITLLKSSQKYFIRQQASLGSINGHIEEMYAGHNLVKVYNGETRAIAKFDQINGELYHSAWKAQFLSGLIFPVMNFVGNLGYVGVSVVGGYLAVKKVINIGDIQAFIQYVRQFNQPIIQTANIANVLQSTAAAAERVFEFLAETEEIAENPNPVQLEKALGNVSFENIKFGYDPKKVIIKKFNAQIKAGQRVAIVGPTGAGKTTIVNLLMRFYDVNQGAIKIDGIDIRDLRRADLRKQFGMVLQDTWLFSDTIKANIKYAKPDATEAELKRATKLAHVDHFVRSLPGGYNMKINEDADNISQGEKQLLTIARAMLANPPMLILDEATSSVDTRTELLIQKAMDNLMQGRTSFVIAHRLSTIRNADLILVMKDGSIVEQGTHNSLLKQKGFYAELYNSQFEE